MSATNFWPRATKYDVHVLQLELPGTLSNTARALINETLVLTDILRANQNTEHLWQSQITALTTQRLKTAFLSLSTHLNDRDSELALEWRAQTFDDQNAKKELCEKIAQMDEKELVCYSGAMSTYLRRVPCDFPDAGAAYVQLKFFVESGCLELNSNGAIHADLAGFYPAVLRLAGHLTENVLQGNIESAELFMRSYCPHHDVENCTNIMANMGVITDTIEYEQRIKEV